MDAPSLVLEGWLLKRKRKRLQGMARRHFRLSSNGQLSYAFNPNSPVRDSILVSNAFISASRKHRTLDIDGGNTVYHCKALTLEDFDRWAAALRKFINVAQSEAAAYSGNVASPTAIEGGGFVGGNLFPTQQSPEEKESSSFAGGAAGGEEEMKKVLELLSGMKQPIHDLELVASELRTAEAQAHITSPSHLSSSPHGHNGGNGSKFRGFLGKRSNSTSQPRDVPAPFANSHRSPSFSSASPPVLPPIPGIGPTQSEPQQLSSTSSSTLSPASAISPTSPNQSYFDAVPSHSPSSSPSNDLLLRQLQTAISTLNSQHEQLTIAIHSLPRPPSHPYLSHDQPLHHGGERSFSPSFSPAHSPFLASSYRSPSGLGFHPSHTRNAPSRASSSRASFSSFFSAQEGEGWEEAIPGEFVLEEEETRSRESSPEMDRRGEGQGGGAGGRGRSETITESAYSAEEEDSEGEDTDGEEEFVDGSATDEDDRATIGGGASPSTSVEGGSSSFSSSALVLEQGTDVRRRTQLPSPVAGDEFSMLSMLRKNVGKDLSTISFPVTMNEPLSALQRIAEELEYSELLDRAAASSDTVERLMLVAVFAVSGVSGNKFRGSRKPFNPLLGETYELLRPDKSFRFISEKVSHQPPRFAFHGEAPKKGWTVEGYVSPSQKFWGRSMEVFVHGDYNVKFADSGEVFSIRKPSSFVRNLVAGTKYLEVVGDLVVTSSLSSASATISFKEGSSWGGASTRNKVEGKIVDEKGNVKIELVGRWDDSVDKKEGKSSFTRLWSIAEPPPNPERYYGFSSFALTLNETTPLEDHLLAPTDSRLRPDQLAFERGDVDEAERLKTMVEEKQRAKRREGRLEGPRWFREGGEGWVYGGEYFETRDKKAFEDPDIFV
ncbi:hypothetical protein JCM8547_000661 [Rhodosporidiobolus lusitaniae]